MKIKHLLIFAAAVAVFAGCNKEQGSPIFRVTPETLLFEAAGGRKDLNVITTGDWKVSGNSYFKVNPTSGNGAGTVTVTVSQTVKDEPISETFTFTCGDKTATVKLTQKGKGAPVDEITVTPSSLDFGADEGYQDVTVTASGPWTASPSQDWVTITPAEGKAGISVSKNKSEERNATVTFTCGNATASLTITQAKPAGPITKLSTADDFLTFIDSFGQYASGTVVEFLNDINFDGVTISKFVDLPATVTLDGKGYAIKNWDNQGAPLFLTISGVVQNLVIDSSCTITYDINYPTKKGQGNGTQFGILAAQNKNLIKGCINNASLNFETFSVSGTTHWGLFVGINRVNIEDCVNKGNVTIGALTGPSSGNFRLGGICGSFADSGTLIPVLKNCTNEGNFTITKEDSQLSFIGGLVGLDDSRSTDNASVEGCINKGAITVSSKAGEDINLHVGGITGGYYGGLLTGCQNFGKVTSAGSAGGITGYTKPTDNKDKVHSAMAGCAVNAEIEGNAARTGLVFGICADNLIYTYGAEDALIRVAGKVNGTVVTGENYKTFLNGSACAPAAESKIHAKFEAVAPPVK